MEDLIKDWAEKAIMGLITAAIGMAIWIFKRQVDTNDETSKQVHELEILPEKIQELTDIMTKLQNEYTDIIKTSVRKTDVDRLWKEIDLIHPRLDKIETDIVRLQAKVDIMTELRTRL